MCTRDGGWETYITLLAQVIVEAEVCGSGRQAGDLGTVDTVWNPNMVWSLTSSLGNFSFFLRLSVDWMKPSILQNVINFTQSLLIEVLITSKKYFTLVFE